MSWELPYVDDLVLIADSLEKSKEIEEMEKGFGIQNLKSKFKQDQGDI